MTATPHKGKEEDFQLFLGLLDRDRFEGKFRDGVHQIDVSDLMRRMVKESLLKLDGRPLFPERIAYTVPYKLSDPEARLYTNTFGSFNPDGTTKTFYNPDPAVHGYSSNLDYWNAQPGVTQ